MEALYWFVLRRLESCLDGFRTGSRAASYQTACQLVCWLVHVALC